MQPPADDGARWSARAGVPQPGDPALRRPAPQEWVEEEDPYQGRSWLRPVFVGMVALVMVAALAFGLFLIYRATVNGQNAPGGVEPSVVTTLPSPPAPTTSPPAATSEAPTSQAPTSSAPPPGQVVIPALRGNTLADATVKLQVLGLNVEVERKADGSLPPGEVLSTRPGEGETVNAGDTVTLIVAAPVSSPAKPGPSASASD
ncbi:PASTA domain-containing protein [Dactylosporangium darangshiense]|uniref:PASTA domain-containing protein n=1 Tax=Dactylosporangium darangshiense TaxID=579108 RepID=UPI003644EA00